jgi:hypothetical protein
MAGVSRLTLPLPDEAATRLLRMAMRGFRPMRRVRMILRLEVLGLVGRSLAIADHELSKFKSRLTRRFMPLPMAALDPAQAGRSMVRRMPSTTIDSSDGWPLEWARRKHEFHVRPPRHSTTGCSETLRVT